MHMESWEMTSKLLIKCFIEVHKTLGTTAVKFLNQILNECQQHLQQFNEKDFKGFI